MMMLQIDYSNCAHCGINLMDYPRSTWMWKFSTKENILLECKHYWRAHSNNIYNLSYIHFIFYFLLGFGLAKLFFAIQVLDQKCNISTLPKKVFITFPSNTMHILWTRLKFNTEVQKCLSNKHLDTAKDVVYLWLVIMLLIFRCLT